MQSALSDVTLSDEASRTNLSPPWYRDRVLVFIILLAAVLGLIYNGVMILGKGADEPRHMAYVKLLLEERTLPFLEPDPNNPGRQREHAGAHSLHPPVYYLLLLPFYAVLRGLSENAAWHMARGVSLVLCLTALPLLYQVALRAGRGNVAVARLVVSHVALLPIFGMTAGTINNDSSSLLTTVLFLWLLAVKYPHERSVKSAVVLGICFGVGAICKATVILCDAAALMAYLLFQGDWRTSIRSARTWSRLGVVLLLVAVIAGPWYVRNYNLYHKFSPIEAGYSPADLNLLPGMDKGILVVVLHDNFPHMLGAAGWGIFYSLWSQKDWLPETIRSAIYAVLVLYCLMALLGWLLDKLRGRASPSPPLTNDNPDRQYNDGATVVSSNAAQRIAIFSSLGAFIINWLACLTMALFMHWGWFEGGRYLLPSLGGLSIFLALGWGKLMGANGLKYVILFWCAGLMLVNVIAIYWLVTYLNPTFG